VKEKKSLLEKFGLVERVLVENENGLNETDGEALEEPQKVYAEGMHDTAAKINTKHTDEPEDITEKVKKKKLFSTEDIYRNYNIKSQGINSLFIVESFLKALPDYLPMDVKRESTLNIVSSSGVRIESLVKDGNDKLMCLKEFSQSFSSDAGDTIAKCENEIRKLTEKINNYKKAIDDMKKLQEEQEAVVRYEAERINNILQFINPASQIK